MRALPRVELVVEPASLERDDAGTIGGRVWLRDGDPEAQRDFPEVGWHDLPVALLAEWLPALQRLAAVSDPTHAGAAACAFLDGPYRVTVLLDGPGAWRLRCAEERSRGPATAAVEWRTDARDFLASVTRAAHSVLAHCDARGWWNRDTEAIRRALDGG